MLISPEQIQQFKKDGYFILENGVTEEQLEALRRECQRVVEAYEAEMQTRDATNTAITHYMKRYFIDNRGNDTPVITDFLGSDLMADVCRAVLGENAYLFNEQYVVKAAEVSTKFGWHQDSGYIGHYHPPYLLCWCALDDMTIDNGTIHVLPYQRAKMAPEDLFEHKPEEGTRDMIGYYGDDPGIPILVPAGSILVFSSRLFHRSGSNTTDVLRRAYMAQFSAAPIMNLKGTKLHSKAIPVLKNGARIAPVWPSG